MLSRLLSQSGTIVRRVESGLTDSYGNDMPTETLIGTSCLVQQVRTGETSGEAPSTSFLAFFPAGTMIDAPDYFILDGARYEVDGDAAHPASVLTGAESHVEVTLRRVGDDVPAS